MVVDTGSFQFKPIPRLTTMKPSIGGAFKIHERRNSLSDGFVFPSKKDTSTGSDSIVYLYKHRVVRMFNCRVVMCDCKFG